MRVPAAPGHIRHIGGNLSRALSWRTLGKQDRLCAALLLIVGAMLLTIEAGASRAGIAGPFDITQNAFTEYALCGAILYLLFKAETTGHAAAMAAAIPVACLVAETVGGGSIAAQGPLLAYSGALACVATQILWALLGEPARAQARMMVACRACLIWLPTMAGGPGMALSAGINPTYDGLLMRFDDSLGIRIAVLVRRAVEHCQAVNMVVFFGYFAIVGALGVHNAVCRRDRPQIDLILLFLGTTVVGYGLYWIYPAGGPPGLAGDYYASVWPTSAGAAPDLTFVPAVGLARNCMPSLHAVWAYLLLMTLDAHKNAATKIGFAVFACLTILGALTWGRHWFVDIVVSLPFAVTAVAAAQSRRGDARLPALVGGSAMVAVWLLTLRFGGTFPPALSWSLIVATVVASLWLLRTLRAGPSDPIAGTGEL